MVFTIVPALQSPLTPVSFLRIMFPETSSGACLLNMKIIVWFIQATVFYLCTLVCALLPECLVQPVGLLVDQAVFTEEGALINFLGRKAWASKAPVLLARKSGAAVVPAFIHRETDRHVIDIYRELSFSHDDFEGGMVAGVQKYTRVIEGFIIRHPADWYWVHRRWKRAGDCVAE